MPLRWPAPAARPRAGPARLRAFALAGAGLLALAACVGGGTAGGPAPGASILGGWTMQPDSACRESLAFRPDGTFLHGVAVALDGQGSERLVAGSYQGSPASDAAGGAAVRLTPQAALADPLLGYCGQWGAAHTQPLDFPAVQAALGVDPALLAYRPLLLPGAGTAWVGTDDAGADRFALLREVDALRGIGLDGTLPAGRVAYHRAPLELPAAYPPGPGSAPVVNVPQFAYRSAFPAAVAGQTVATFLLSVHSTVDVGFGPAGGLPSCELIAHDQIDFTSPALPNPLAGATAAAYLTFYPGPDGDPAPLLTVLPGGGAAPLYLLPIEVQAPAGGACGLAIRARPTAARLVQEALTGPAPDAMPALTLDGAPAFLLGVPADRPVALEGLALQAGGGVRVARLLPRVAQPAPGWPDPLGLLSGAGGELRLSVQSLDGAPFLNVFPAEGSTGLGPFAAAEALAPVAPLTQSVSYGVDLPGPAPVTVPFALAAAALLRVETDGGVATAGTLLDGEGTQLTHARGGSDAGTTAPDGAGLRIIAALAAGAYALRIESASAPAAFTLRLDLLPATGVADARLAACLLQAAGDATAPEHPRAAGCGAQGIATLAGIGAFGGLRALRLDDNPLTDLAALADLGALAELSLEGIAPASLAPLAGLTRLHRLSLARVALGAADLSALQDLARLTWLDLRDATGVAPADLAALKAALPDTQIVAPDGTVLE